MTNLTNLQNPIIIGHRGFGVTGLFTAIPENTIYSFEKALEDGADGVELDLMETRDGEIVVFHDRNLLRMAGVKREIKDLTLEEIQSVIVRQRYDIGQELVKVIRSHPEMKKLSILNFLLRTKFALSDKASPCHKAMPCRIGKIPLLSEVLDVIGEKAQVLGLELKEENKPYAPYVKKIASIVKKAGIGKKVAFISFSVELLNLMKKEGDWLYLGLIPLFKTKPGEIDQFISECLKNSFSYMAIPPTILEKEVVEKIQKAGLTVATFAEDKKTLEKGRRLGINIFVTDRVDLLSQKLKIPPKFLRKFYRVNKS